MRNNTGTREFRIQGTSFGKARTIHCTTWFFCARAPGPAASRTTTARATSTIVRMMKSRRQSKLKCKQVQVKFVQQQVSSTRLNLYG